MGKEKLTGRWSQWNGYFIPMQINLNDTIPQQTETFHVQLEWIIQSWITRRAVCVWKFNSIPKIVQEWVCAVCVSACEYASIWHLRAPHVFESTTNFQSLLACSMFYHNALLLWCAVLWCVHTVHPVFPQKLRMNTNASTQIAQITRTHPTSHNEMLNDCKSCMEKGSESVKCMCRRILWYTENEERWGFYVPIRGSLIIIMITRKLRAKESVRNSSFICEKVNKQNNPISPINPYYLLYPLTQTWLFTYLSFTWLPH